MTTVVQLSYYAIPGKEQDVLSIRLSACDVLEKTTSPAVACFRRTVEAFSASGGENQKRRGGNKRAANCVDMVKPF
jgi:hypothetical protein